MIHLNLVQRELLVLFCHLVAFCIKVIVADVEHLRSFYPSHKSKIENSWTKLGLSMVHYNFLESKKKKKRKVDHQSGTSR
jgi:hypothetical protein